MADGLEDVVRLMVVRAAEDRGEAMPATMSPTASK